METRAQAKGAVSARQMLAENRLKLFPPAHRVVTVHYLVYMIGVRT
jgi:hypothetical protein